MLKFFRLPFATTGDKTTVPDAVDSNGNVSYSQGYGFDYQRQKTDPAAKNIERDKMNQILFDITTAIAELQSQGAPDYITSALNGGTAYSYGQYAIVKYSGALYISLVAANTALPSDATKWALLPTPALLQQSAYMSANAAGTVDAITAAFTPAIAALPAAPGTLSVFVRATGANTSTTPTFKADGTAAKTIVKGNNAPLLAGDIAGAGHWLGLQYDPTLDKWILLNPATGVSGIVSNGVAGYSANTTLTGADLGRACYASSATAITLTLPAIPASGKVILISNQGAGVVTVARAGSATIGAFGSVGLTSITLNYGESIALCSDGTNWFQMLGNQGAIGVGQAWQSVGGSRVAGATYYNTTAKPIMVSVGMTTTVANAGIYATVSPGYTLWGSNSANSPYVAAICFIVPPGGSYSVQMQSGTTTILTWLELR